MPTNYKDSLMQVKNKFKKICNWAIHIIVWFFINIILGSLPFGVTLLREESLDPFIVGLLCFCFTVASSGLYLLLVKYHKEKQTELGRGIDLFLVSLAVIWIVFVWTIVLMLPSILDIIGNKPYKGLAILYVFSILLFFVSNFKMLSELVNMPVYEHLITDPVIKSRDTGNKMKDKLEDEGGF
jgi:hypothetical protein